MHPKQNDWIKNDCDSWLLSGPYSNNYQLIRKPKTAPRDDFNQIGKSQRNAIDFVISIQFFFRLIRQSIFGVFNSSVGVESIAQRHSNRNQIRQRQRFNSNTMYVYWSPSGTRLPNNENDVHYSVALDMKKHRKSTTAKVTRPTRTLPSKDSKLVSTRVCVRALFHSQELSCRCSLSFKSWNFRLSVSLFDA